MSDCFSKIQGVLFDLDGTLVDSAPDLSAAANSVRADRGLPPLPMSAYRAYVGTGARGMLAVGLGIEPTHPDFDFYKESFFSAYEQRLQQATRPFDGVEKVIRILNACEIPWGIVTNKAQRFTHPLVQAISLFDSAATVISGDTTPHSKPHPAPLLEAARRMGLPEQHFVYVGDDERDIQAASAANMRSIVAAYGYLGNAKNYMFWGGDDVIHSPEDLLHCLNLI